ncbi:MAG: response regulator [Bacteroides sp.]|nr:response regulator [Bacteroides sp.]
MYRTLGLVLFLTVSLLSGAQDISFKHLTIKDELSHYSVMALYQDERDLLWMGTRNGISVYDGNEIQVYRHDDNDEHSIQSNLIRDITGDREGHIYFLTIRGVSMFSIANEEFTALHTDNVGAIHCHEGGLYIGKENEVMQWKEGQLTSIYRLPSAESRISSLLVSGDSLFIGTEEEGLWLYSRKAQHLSHPIPQGRISRISRDSRGEYWIGTWNDGLYIFSKEGLKNYRHHSQEDSSLCADFVRTFCEDRQGNMWIGTFRGLSKYLPESDSFRNYREQDKASGGMSHSSIWSMICDHQGTLWFGTYFGGVNYFTPTQEIVHHLGQEQGSNESVIGAMTEDGERNLWICTEGDGLYCLNRNNGQVTHYTHKEQGNSISHNNLKSILYDAPRNVLWIGTHLGGLNKLDLKSRKFTHYTTKRGTDNTHKSNIICDIIKQGNGLLLATHDGVYRFDIASETFQPLFKDEAAGPVISLALDLHIGQDSLLWIAGAEEGAFVYHPKERRLTLHSHSTRAGSLSSNGINCLYEDSRCRMWLGTAEKGIDCYNRTANTFENFNENEHKLLSNCIYGVSEVAPDRLIILSDNGFCYFDTEEGITRNFKANSNLPLSAINQNSIYLTRDGELFIGGVDGLISFRPDNLSLTQPDYRIFPTKLFVNDKEIKVNDGTGILKETLSQTKEITLKPGQSMFSITYAITNYNPLNREEIVYRLENFSKEWTTLRNGRMITYTNLNPGTYSLMIKPQEEETNYHVLKVTVLPPWYQTTAAYIGYFLLVTSLLYVIISFYKNRLRLQAALEYERKHIEDIENLNQHKLRFFTNISHEFRTPLTLITSQIELLLQVKSFVPAIYNRLLNAYKSSLQLQSLINELLDFRKQEQGHMKIKASEYNIVDFLHENYLLFQEYAHSKQIGLSFHTSDEEIKVWYDAKQMQKVINNLLSNAFQYTPSGKEIALNVTRGEKSVCIQVKDSGCGIPNDEIGNIFDRFYQTERTLHSPGKGIGIGLALTKGIVELHHGSISVESRENACTTFTVTLLLGKAHLKEEEIASDTPELIAKPKEEKQELCLIEEDELNIKEKDGNPFTILIVEDDSSLRNMLNDIFTPYYNILSAANGEEALTLLEEHHPDIIVTDILMPGISGIELCKQVKENINTCHIPVVLLTARTALEHKLEGLKTGADDYITKPFEINILLARCRNLINNRLVLQEKFSRQPHATPQIFATNPLDKEFMDKVMKVIEQHMDDTEFNVNVFAQEMCIARTKLFVKLKAITGKTPNDLILSLRLKRAALYLRNNPEMNITDISERIGFNSPRYFSKCFKDTYNMSPQAYRHGEHTKEEEEIETEEPHS